MIAAFCHKSNCSIFPGEQNSIKTNNLIVAHWLNILCKRGGVKCSDVTVLRWTNTQSKLATGVSGGVLSSSRDSTVLQNSWKLLR